MLLERILRNLVSNALRYTERGGAVVGCRRRGTSIVLEVWDTGRGIAEAEREHIFEEFYQSGDSDDDARRGLGLGLAIVRRLAALLGHRVEVFSRVGRGSVFRVQVPRAPPRSEAAAPVAPATGTLAGRRVVVIDDEAPVREGMERLLGGWGCEPIVVADAESAIAALRDGAPADVLVVDYRLRGGRDGLQAIDAVRKAAGRAIPALIVSGESHADELARIKASGLLIVHKPVPPARLRSVIAWLVSTDRAAA
jgi:CheY-like chemotaxis protein